MNVMYVSKLEIEVGGHIFTEQRYTELVNTPLLHSDGFVYNC